LWHKYGGLVLRAQFQLAWEAIKSWRGAAARARLRGMLAAMWDLPLLLRKRRGIQAMRTVPIDYLETVLSAPKNRGALVKTAGKQL
jgi:hypothetical protein